MQLGSLLQTLFFLSLCSPALAEEETEYQKAFQRLFPEPKTLTESEKLFRFNNTNVFLKNAPSVRDLKSDSGDTHWWPVPSTVYQGSYFARPPSKDSSEFWIETAKRPIKRTKIPDEKSDFEKDEIMLIKKLTYFEDKISFKLKRLDIENGYFLSCKEEFLKGQHHTLPEGRSKQPLSCLYVDSNFCSTTPSPISAEAAISHIQTSSDDQEKLKHIQGILNKEVFAHWADIDTLFRGIENTPPAYAHALNAEQFTSVDISELDSACKLLVWGNFTKNKAEGHSSLTE
ncbi:MAG: hypothetical protein R3A80_02565 [Bdellovibrionota bacterium]